MGLAPNLDADTLRDQLIQLLPRGPIWPQLGDSSTLTALLGACAQEMARVCARAAQLRLESDPYTATETLEDWESLLELDPAGLSTSERQTQAGLAWYGRTGSTEAELVAYATSLGYSNVSFTKGFDQATCESNCAFPLQMYGPFVGLLHYGFDTGPDIAGVWAALANCSIVDFPTGTNVDEPFSETWPNHTNKIVSTAAGAVAAQFDQAETEKPTFDPTNWFNTGDTVRISFYLWGQDGAEGSVLTVTVGAPGAPDSTDLDVVIPDNEWIRVEGIVTMTGDNTDGIIGFSYTAAAGSEIVAIYNIRAHGVDTALEAWLSAHTQLHAKILPRAPSDDYILGAGYDYPTS